MFALTTFLRVMLAPLSTDSRFWMTWRVRSWTYLCELGLTEYKQRLDVESNRSQIVLGTRDERGGKGEEGEVEKEGE
jgi:hypothetical protein